MTLGKRLHAARFAKGYKMREVTALTGVSKATISRAERDTLDIQSNTLFRLAGCYGVSVDSLLGEGTRQMTTGTRPNEALQAALERVPEGTYRTYHGDGFITYTHSTNQLSVSQIKRKMTIFVGTLPDGWMLMRPREDAQP